MYTLGVEPILWTLPSVYWLIIWRWNKSALVQYDSLFTIQLLDKIVPCSKPGNKEPLIEASIGQGQISPSNNHLLLLSKYSRNSQELWLHHALSPLQNCRERSFSKILEFIAFLMNQHCFIRDALWWQLLYIFQRDRFSHSLCLTFIFKSSNKLNMKR